MPSRRRSNLNRRSRNATRKRLIRSQETTADMEARLARKRESYACALRSSTQRTRTSACRLQETDEESQARLSSTQIFSLSQESETYTEQHESQPSTSQILRESATYTEHELHENRLPTSQIYSLSRESATYTERESRQSTSQIYSLSRESATYTERESRQSTSQIYSLSRESATYTERESRQSTSQIFSLSRESATYTEHEQHESRLPTSQILLLTQESETYTERESHLSLDGRIDEDLALSYNNNASWSNREKAAFAYSPYIDYSVASTIGRKEMCCNFCSALKWRTETNGMCCSGGKVCIDIWQNPPELMKLLLNGEHIQSKHFLDNIRRYNSAFQMTSFGANQISEGPFMPTFKVQGQVYHLIGSLLPQNEPKFLQIYFVSDYNEQSNIRNRNFPKLNSSLLSQLQNMLHEINPFVHSFKVALESIPQSNLDSYKMVISADRRPVVEHRGRYNAPAADEVAVVLADQECDSRDIVLRTHDNHLQRIMETHRAYDALQYPLIYSRGEDGYNFQLYQIDPTTRILNYNKKVSAQQFYSYLLQIRSNQFIYIQRFRALFSQFIVDMYAKVETERLVYIRNNQSRLRAEEYVHLRDAMQHDSADNLGRLVILPSSFTGGPRYMHERTQDAFCYVRKYGRPDLFITFTTNPKWDEISNELLPGQSPHDRHDIIARVFYLKLKLLVKLLTKDNIFGSVFCYMYSIEWQKRGLPHAHLLIWLEQKIRPDSIDNVISAEFPNQSEDPILHDIVKTQMVHGPCGALNVNSPCMVEGRCTKKYPRALIAETMSGEKGYPMYRRRSTQDGGFTAICRLRGDDIVIDNKWVVPYSPVLLKTFRAHINVEMCNSVESIKYICKYINKGSDQAMFALRNERDEVTRYQSGRYISTSEAIWRLFSFPLHERYPPVIHLSVHTEGRQQVYFNADNVEERIQNPRQTTLLAFFSLCQVDNFAKGLLYDEVPSYYTFNKAEGTFNRRRRGTVVEGAPGILKEHVIGRVYAVHPNNQECYYLRLLLHTVRGPTSFDDLRKVDSIVYPTYQAACRARNILDGDEHWDNALAEASVSDSPHRLRHLFAVLLVFCGLSNPEQLWLKYNTVLSEDYVRMQQNCDVEINATLRDNIFNRCLLSIQDIVITIGGNLLSQYGLPAPRLDDEYVNGDVAELNFDPQDMTDILHNNLEKLTSEQRLIYDRVCHSVVGGSGEMLFLDAPGGTGKTFLTKIILAEIRRKGKLAIAVASSGIAATMLPGGKTAHAMFKIPINLDATESPVCSISRNSNKAEMFRNCSLVIWDECTMSHRKAVEAVDRTLRDIKQVDLPMGGICMLFCGDFRQTLPVVPKGTRADEVKACLKSSPLWRSVITTSLTTNMRTQTGGSTNAKEFAEFLLKIGDGSYPHHQGKVVLPNTLCHSVASVQDLVTSVYGNTAYLLGHPNTWLCERAILTPRNDQARVINDLILENIPGHATEYHSINRVVDQEDSTSYPIEFLNSLNTPGLPAHTIKLKVGVPIILLRNLCPPKLCNGTRLKVTNLQPNVIEAEILTGCGAGDSVFIPRIPLIPNNFPFSFKRIQYPISLCYAMTINKSQGQTFSVAGVELSVSCFSHGQLYVALSRISNSNNLYVYIPDNLTSNIVYREALI